MPPSAPESTCVTCSLLLVEDDAELLEIFSRRFTRRGFEVAVCGEFEAVLATASQRKFDVVVMDRTLRGRDCVQLIPQLRELHPALQVIVLSGRSDAPSIQEARDAGAGDYLVKPCAFADIEAAIVRVRGK